MYRGARRRLNLHAWRPFNGSAPVTVGYRRAPRSGLRAPSSLLATSVTVPVSGLTEDEPLQPEPPGLHFPLKCLFTVRNGSVAAGEAGCQAALPTPLPAGDRKLASVSVAEISLPVAPFHRSHIEFSCLSVCPPGYLSVPLNRSCRGFRGSSDMGEHTETFINAEPLIGP